MRRAWLLILLLAQSLFAQQPERGPYARIAVLRPHDGKTVEFEAGYIRHLEWHKGTKDPFAWYGWTVWAGERQRLFVHATFSHSDDERDNILDVTPHAEFLSNGLYEYLPALSRGNGVPQTPARVELTIVDLVPGSVKRFEAGLAAQQSRLQGETLWFRTIAGGHAPRYVRMRPRASLAASEESAGEQALPDGVTGGIEIMTIEILNLRPAMSHGLP